MLNRLMTSRRVRGILLTVVLLSAVVAILSVAIPLNRKRDAVTSLGEQSLSEASSLAMSMEYYNGLRIQSLLDYPSETVFYQNLCGFLFRAKQTLSYDRAYILYQGLEGRIAYLADADYAKDLQAGVDYHAIGEEYTDERYTRRCISILQEQFEGRRKETYVPDILDESYIIAYLPLRNADGEVMAVLGVDAKLGYSDFAQYGPINFERLTSISALLDVYKRQSLQRRMRQCWYFCICLRQFVYKRETRKEREKWKEVKFGKQHRNIRTDITAVKRSSAPTASGWEWMKRPPSVQRRRMDWGLQECSRPAAAYAV